MTEHTQIVLAATDLSRLADEALRHGHIHAAARGRPLVVCHITSNQVDMAHVSETVSARASEVTGRQRSELEAVVGTGAPEVAIVELARARRAELIAIGSSGDARGLDRVLGTVAERVVRAAPCSVLVARPRRGLRVLVATDLSEPSIPAIAEGAREAKRRGVPLTVLHCVEPSADPTRSDDARIECARDEILAAAARFGVEAEVSVLVGPPAETILRACDGVGADLVVVATRGRTGLDRVLLGSTAEAVVRGAPCAVLVARSGPA